MFEYGIFPDMLKIARVCPIHKGGTDHSTNNYRPISVLPVLSKVFETIMNVRIECFITKYNILCEAQHGFRKGRSCEQALLKAKHEIIDNFEQRLYTIGLFIDLRKAFDSVNNDVLLDKLHDYGIRGVALKLVQSYLTNRYQYVTINNVKSQQLKIVNGVPQGSAIV